MIEAPMLALPDCNKPLKIETNLCYEGIWVILTDCNKLFMIETNLCYEGIWVILQQERHPIAFFRQSLL